MTTRPTYRFLMKGLLLASVFVFFILPTATHAIGVADTGLDFATATNLSGTDIRLIIAQVIRVVLGLLGILAIGLILYAGFLWMTSGGNEEQVEKSKAILQNSMIGLIIVLASYSIVLFMICRVLAGAGLVSICPQNNANTNTSSVNRLGNPILPNGALFLTVTSRSPAPGASAPRNTSVSVTFNENIERSTIRMTDLAAGAPACAEPSVSVCIAGTDGSCQEQIPGAVKVRGSALTFNPSNKCGPDKFGEAPGLKTGQPACDPSLANNGACGCLLPDTFSDEDFAAFPNGVPIKVTLRKSIASVTGRPLYQDVEWTFLVKNEFDTTSPKVASILPANNPSGSDPAPANTGVQVLFNKDIDPTTFVLPGTIEEGQEIPATIIITKKSDNSLVEGTIADYNTRGFVFRPTKPCESTNGQDVSGCSCFDFSTAYHIELKDKVTTTDATGATITLPGIKDNHCNALDCGPDKASCNSEFSTSNELDTTPPVVTVVPASVGDVSYAVDKPLISPVDPASESIKADRTAKVFMSLCDKTTALTDPGCRGNLNTLSLNEDTWVVGNTIPSIDINLPPSPNDAACCFLPGGDYGKACVGGALTQCPVVSGAARVATINAKYTPRNILDAQRKYYATAYGGGSLTGSCSTGSSKWGVQDLAGNSLIALDEAEEVLPNLEWSFTTSDQINAGNPYISYLNRQDYTTPAGYREQCVTIVGANFGDASNLTTGISQPYASIPYQDPAKRCVDPIAGDGKGEDNCKGWVVFRKKCTLTSACVPTDGETTCSCTDAEDSSKQCAVAAGSTSCGLDVTHEASMYSWVDKNIVATVPNITAGQDINDLYDVFVRMSWGDEL